MAAKKPDKPAAGKGKKPAAGAKGDFKGKPTGPPNSGSKVKAPGKAPFGGKGGTAKKPPKKK